MDLYTSVDYKQCLRSRLQELKSKKSHWTFRRLADHLGLQSTYLSKVMNSDQHHLSDDDLFSICKILQFLPLEIEYIQLLKDHQTTSNSDRKTILKVRLEKLQKDQSLDVDVKKATSSVFNNEVDYLLNPTCVLIHVALMSATLKKDVRVLGTKLGIKTQKLKEYLKILELNNLIKIDPYDPWKINSVTHWRTHFHRDHPLVRTSQNLIRQMSLTRLSQTPEDEKQSLNFTFTLDQKNFEKVKTEFQSFLKKIESISKSSLHDEVYQMNFDLFKWL
jgi:uncharacterized protein (TIGR02147 family)